MLAERRQPEHEYYVAVLNDRASQGVVLVASAQGGMNIEEVAAKDPAAIITTPISFEHGLSKEEAIGVAQKIGFKTPETQAAAADIFINLYRIFKEKDATQIEINPMALTTDGEVLWYVIPVKMEEKFTFYPLVAWMLNSGSTTTLNSARKISSPSVISLRRSRLRLKPRRLTSTSSN